MPQLESHLLLQVKQEQCILLVSSIHRATPEQVRVAERATVSFAKIEYLPLLKRMFHLARFQRQYHMASEKIPVMTPH